MSINAAKLILSPPLQQNFIDPDTREPAVGNVYFYKAGTEILKPVYYRSGDPDNPFVAAPNPLPLNSAGALPYSIFAYPISESDQTTLELYDLVVKNTLDVEIFRINDWPENATTQSTTGNVADEYIVNGQFNYPIKFYTDSNQVNQITLSSTGVAASWQYETDADLKVINRFVEFEEIINGIEADLPEYLCIVDGTNIDSTESFSHLIQTIGPVETLASQTMTFSFYGQDRNGNGANIELFLRRNYGPTDKGASAQDDILIGSFTVTSVLSQFVTAIDIPSLDGKNLASPSSLSFYFSYPVGTAYKIGVTTVIGRKGAVDNPQHLPVATSLLNAAIWGQSIDLQNRSNADNFAYYAYFNGQTVLSRQTGTFLRVAKNAVKQNMLILTNVDQSLNVDGSNQYGIPYRNLFNVIGTDWGSDGDLSISAKDDVLTFTGLVSGPPFNGYDNGYTVGTIQATKTPAETRSNKYGIKVTISGSNALVFENATGEVFTPGGFDTTELPGNGQPNFKYNSASVNLITSLDKRFHANFATITKATGSGSASVTDNATGASWQTTLVFNDSQALSYESSLRSITGISNSNLQWTNNSICISSSATNGGYLFAAGQTHWSLPNKLFVYFTVDGKGNYLDNAGQMKNAKIVVPVPLSKTDTLPDILKKTRDAITNPFIINFTFNAVPQAGQYFLYSSVEVTPGSGTQFYAWYFVDGVGTDPMIAGATGQRIDINSSDSISEVVNKTKNQIVGATFNVPSYDKIGMTLTAQETGKNEIVVIL